MGLMDPTTLFSGIIFGGIGFAAFIYGKKERSIKPMLLGVALMVYPYFIANAIIQIIVGVVLTGLLFYPN
jgi:hypothetical protein